MRAHLFAGRRGAAGAPRGSRAARVVATAVLAGTLIAPARPASAASLTVTFTMDGFPNALRACATATASGFTPAVITIQLDMDGAEVHPFGMQPISARISESRPGANQVDGCTGAFNVSRPTGSGLVVVSASAVATAGLATFAATCEGEAHWVARDPATGKSVVPFGVIKQC
ncbi:MAG: hypothetical protein HY775_04290 [Acidobacteria bacterium]|nr:hypothetical protein [Acidobacteriota bacterium]